MTMTFAAKKIAEMDVPVQFLICKDMELNSRTVDQAFVRGLKIKMTKLIGLERENVVAVVFGRSKEVVEQKLESGKFEDLELFVISGNHSAMALQEIIQEYEDPVDDLKYIKTSVISIVD